MAVLRVAAGLLILAACGGDSGSSSPSSTTTAPASTTTTVSVTTTATAPAATTSTPTEGACADVVAVELTPSDDGTFQVSATVSSADTGNEKYADEWRVVAPNGTVLGVRVLTHPHVNEQPFTRSLSGVEIGPGVESVTVEARDSVEGYCGSSVTVAVP